MWCCKSTSFYETVCVHDIMIVFKSSVGGSPEGLVVDVCIWTGGVSVRTYLSSPTYQHRFDCMYNPSSSPMARNANGGPWHRGDSNDNRQGNGMTGYEYDHTRRLVLLSTRFCDFHDSPKPLPPHLPHLVHKGRGCSKRTMPLRRLCRARVFWLVAFFTRDPGGCLFSFRFFLVVGFCLVFAVSRRRGGCCRSRRRGQ